MPSSARRRRTRALHDVAEADFVEAQVAVLVALGGGQLRRCPREDDLGQPLGQHATPSVRPLARRLTIAPTSVSTIVPRRTFRPRNSSGMSVSVAPGGLADAERQVAGLPAHGDDEVPATGGLRVDHQVVDDLDADRARRLVAEGPDVVRADRGRCRSSWARGRRAAPPAPAWASLWAVKAVSSPPMVISMPTPSRSKRREDVAEVLGALGRVRARDADAGAAAEVDAARVLDGQRGDVR